MPAPTLSRKTLPVHSYGTTHIPAPTAWRLGQTREACEEIDSKEITQENHVQQKSRILKWYFVSCRYRRCCCSAAVMQSAPFHYFAHRGQRKKVLRRIGVLSNGMPSGFFNDPLSYGLPKKKSPLLSWTWGATSIVFRIRVQVSVQISLQLSAAAPRAI